MKLDGELKERIESLLGGHVSDTRRVEGGYTPVARWLVRRDSGETAFAKAGTTPGTAEALRKEAAVYQQLEAVCETLDRVHASHAPLPRFGDRFSFDGQKAGWETVRADPASFLGLGIAGEPWLLRALPVLVAAEAAAQSEDAGDHTTVIHLDVRSDNLCLTDRGVVLIDWNLACLGNPEIDTGFWLPSLELEGGPAPEAVLPRAPEVASWVSGFFAARAGLADVPDAPRVRAFQRAQLVVALAWAIRALDLPPLD